MTGATGGLRVQALQQPGLAGGPIYLDYNATTPSTRGWPNRRRRT